MQKLIYSEVCGSVRNLSFDWYKYADCAWFACISGQGNFKALGSHWKLILGLLARHFYRGYWFSFMNVSLFHQVPALPAFKKRHSYLSADSHLLCQSAVLLTLKLFRYNSSPGNCYESILFFRVVCKNIKGEHGPPIPPSLQEHVDKLLCLSCCSAAALSLVLLPVIELEAERCSLDSLGAFTDEHCCGPAVTLGMHSDDTHS